jgi:hypothetical protein
MNEQFQLANIDALNLEAKCNELRDLNAELLAMLKDVRTYVCYSASTSTIRDLDKLIAKAEGVP